MAKLLLALLAAVALCGSSCEPTRGSEVSGAVSLAGRRIDVAVFATEKERRSAVPRLAPLPEGRGYLLAWPRDRFMKLESDAAQASFDVAFLNRSGAVVDLQTLSQGDREGIMPKVEASFALFLPPGSLGKAGVKVGDRAELPAVLPIEELPVVTVGGIPVSVELALTEADRQRGLMFRPRLSAEEGMLFAYGSDGMRAFWMGNTLIPLDIAFIAADGTLVNVNETPTYPNPRNPPAAYATSDSAAPARYVLETNLGWFRRKGLLDAQGKVKPGTRAELPPQAVRGGF